MLRLRVEGPANQVRTFIRDFSVLPQHNVKATSKPYQDEHLENGDVRSFCHFEYYPLNVIHQPITVTFGTPDGKDLTFALLRGSVLRIGDVISVSGKVTPRLLK
ncbi:MULTISPECIES: hypothetical protein [Laceyella]|uniref:Uncharacterized protein n=2 Tax=Laceyella TaxID=292635 RepID=A0ABY5U2K2_LACSH|nr:MULTISPECIES: hypothetical protein [Laceyella]PRZ16323.1 hypothetical protein CLV36_10231 [Laceyella sediminis]UWE03409.1 hypothetical protein NYR52_15090 [Laceyella sacchari]